MIPRFQSFGTKLLLLMALVVAGAQTATWFIVSRYNRSQAQELIESDFQKAGSAFAKLVAERNNLLIAGASTAARDYAVKPLFVGDDAETLKSALESIRLSSRSDIVTALDLEGRTLASTSSASPAPGFHAGLVSRAEADPRPQPSASGFGYFDGQLYSLVVAPVRAPDIIAWLAIGFQIDHRFVSDLKQITGIDLTFLDQQGRPLATTLAPDPARALATALGGNHEVTGTRQILLHGETALVDVRRLPVGAGQTATLALQFSLDEKMQPAHTLQNILQWVATGSLLIAVLLSRAFAGRLVRPIVELVGQTRRIATGDYRVRGGPYRTDELGRLAQAFDEMSHGLAERDQVRDLLDKNVSPEVAAQLMRDGAALGGEEREVTILFADLRGFTTFSERLAPREVVTQLNRYLDRMSAEIERHGGVIDKFIGDEIMALFGAPVAQADSADRALAAALAMQAALAKLNAELAAEGKPPMAVGIGINTARVVAGNIGSHRRLNYSVIGDGVNVAARLQTLTRNPDYAAAVILSAATKTSTKQAFALRPLGEAVVKGRSAPISLFALD